jgi:hypothetical protein
VGKKRSDTERRPVWFKNFFGETTEHFVELRVFPNSRGPIIARDWVQDVQSFDDFVNAYDDKVADAAVYFAPALRGRKGGKKDDVACTHVLWAEIDTDKLGWDALDTAQIIHELPGALQPSLCIHSGHGIHLYWYLSEIADDLKAVEGINQMLRDTFSGDNVWNIDRVMRVPYTWNTKAKPVQSKIIWHYHWHRHTMQEVHDAIAEFDSVLVCEDEKLRFIPRKQWEKQDAERYALQTNPDYGFKVANEDGRKTKNARGIQIWKQCRYGGGPGHVGLDEAIMLFTAYEYCTLHLKIGETKQQGLDRIVENTIAKIKEVKSKDAPDEHWDWNAEHKEVRAKLMRWVRRWDGLKAERDGGKGKDRKAKHATEI